jgi:hypothetical protein
MPALPRISFGSDSSFRELHLSSRRRAALKMTLRRLEVARSASGAGTAGHWTAFGFHLWMSLLLFPVILCLMLMLSLVRILGGASRWIVIWCGGFLAGGLLAWCGNWVMGTGYSPLVVWAAGGFLGLVVLSSFYGMCLEWLFWLSRHENNPYVGCVSLSPEQQAARIAFAKSLHWPTALASASGAFLFSLSLFPLIAGTQTEWPPLAWWVIVGALALAVQGFLLGLFLGWKRNRVVFDSSKHSLGEFVGWQIAGRDQGLRPAFGWGLGYALHQLPTGAIAGLALGLVIGLFLA